MSRIAFKSKLSELGSQGRLQHHPLKLGSRLAEICFLVNQANLQCYQPFPSNRFFNFVDSREQYLTAYLKTQTEKGVEEESASGDVRREAEKKDVQLRVNEITN